MASIKLSWKFPDRKASMIPPEAFVDEFWVNGAGLARAWQHGARVVFLAHRFIAVRNWSGDSEVDRPASPMMRDASRSLQH